MSKAKEVLDYIGISESSDSVMDHMVNQMKLADVIDGLDDDQTEELLISVYQYFKDKFQLKKNEQEAFDMFMGLVQKMESRKVDPAWFRNQTFKAALSLKMKLPSGSF